GPRGRARWLAATAAGYVAVLLAVLGPLAWGRDGFAGGDWTDLHYPFYRFARDVFRAEGALPLWNPWILSGMPHLSSLNVMSLYPVELASLPFGLEPSRFFALDAMLHLALAGTAFCWWQAGAGRSRAAAFTGGLCYMLGGHVLTLAAAGHPHWVRCLAWLPLLLASVERGSFAAAGALLSLTMLTAALQFTALALAVLAFWIPATHPGGARAGVRGFAVCVLTLAALGAVAWVPGFEHYSQSVRSADEAGRAARWALSPWEAPLWLLPELYGGALAYWGPHQFRTSTDYAGLLPLCLAGAALAARDRRELRWVLLLIAGCVLALGPGTPVGAVVARLPVFAGFRTALRWWSFAHLALCVLATRGWDEMRSRAGFRRWAAGCLVAWSAACGVASLRPAAASRAVARLPFAVEHLRLGDAEPADLEAGVRSAFRLSGVRAAVTAGALGLLGALPAPAVVGLAWGALAVDALTAAVPYVLTAPDDPAADDPVADAVVRRALRRGSAPARAHTQEYFGLPNRRMPRGIEWTTGYHGVPLGRYARFLDAAVTRPDTGLLSLLGVRTLVVPSGDPLPEWRGAERVATTGGGEVLLIDNPGAFPLAFLAGRVLPCDGPDAALAALCRPGRPRDAIPVEDPPPETLGAAPARDGRIALAREREAIRATVTLPRAGVLVLAEVWHPAWRAWIDGRRARVMKACLALRAVAVPGGTHELRMRFDPVTLRIGMWISCVALVIAVGSLWRAP
ncbi:MAG: hypothetical protein AAB368_16475, partial [bacterium]